MLVIRIRRYRTFRTDLEFFFVRDLITYYEHFDQIA
jgi:hypothetical protein